MPYQGQIQETHNRGKNELWLWREENENKEKSSKDPNKDKKTTDKAIALAVEKQVNAKLKALQDKQQTEDASKAFIMSCICEAQHEKKGTKKVTKNESSISSSAILKKIIEKAKNG